MKHLVILLLSFISLHIYAQRSLSMDEVEGKREVSMADVDGRQNEGVYTYFAKGETEPFTGILFAKHPNGNFASRQEFIKGIGQGKWINYYPNGNFKEIGYYNQNLVEGPIRKFYSDGTLQAEGNYKDWRIRIGEWTYYDEQGKLLRTEDYGDKGNIDEVQEYYDRGEISYDWYRSILTSNGFKL